MGKWFLYVDVISPSMCLGNWWWNQSQKNICVKTTTHILFLNEKQTEESDNFNFTRNLEKKICVVNALEEYILICSRLWPPRESSCWWVIQLPEPHRGPQAVTVLQGSWQQWGSPLRGCGFWHSSDLSEVIWNLQKKNNKQWKYEAPGKILTRSWWSYFIMIQTPD